MRSALLIGLLLLSIPVFAQNKKLDSLRKSDDLAAYIDESIAIVNKNPSKQLLFLNNIFKQLWRKPNTEKEHLTFLNLRCVQGFYQLQQSNILASIATYENAFNYYNKFKLANFEIIEYVIKPLSNNYTRLGDYEKAVHLQKKTINFLELTKGNPREIAAMYGNMAISFRSMSNYKDAKSCVETGLKLVSGKSETAFLLNNILADVLFDEGSYTKGLALIERNIASSKIQNPPIAYWQMSAFTTAGDFHQKLKNLGKADAYYSKALNLINTYYKGSKLREKANLLTKKGKIQLLLLQPKVALAYYNQTLMTLKLVDRNGHVLVDKIYGENKLVDVFSQMAEAKLLLKLENEAVTAFKLALLTGDKIRNEFAYDKTKERLQGELKLITEKAIEVYYQLYKNTGQQRFLIEILALIEKSKSRTLLDQIQRNQRAVKNKVKDPLFTTKENLDRAIIYNEKQALDAGKNASNNIGDLRYELAMVDKQIKLKYQQYKIGDLGVSTTLASLPQTKIISFFVGKKSIYVLSIADRKVTGVLKIDNAPQAKKLVTDYVTTYFQNGPTAMTNSPKAFYHASNQVYKKLIGYINIVKNESVVIIPDDVLGYLSFDGLITSNNYSSNISKWPFLIKKNYISYAFSLATLVSNKPKNRLKNLTGLFVDYKNENARSLNAVQEEAQGIGSKIRSTMLFNKEVNLKSFNTAFTNSNVLHIGAHAYLSGKEQQPTLDFGVEKVFLFELSAKKKTPNLVLLSACKTADGVLANGEGIISFSRGFSAIGTPATIAGLWNVNDAASSIITNSFYRNLLAKHPAAEALHLAKLDWLSAPKNTDALYLPYYWDSLTYMGNDQVIELQKPTNWWLILWVVSVIAAVSTILVFRYSTSKNNWLRVIR